MGCAFLDIVSIILTTAQWIIIIQAIMSWLIAFNVINMSNNALRQVWMVLDRMTEPMYRPIRRIMPDLGALDLSPMVVLLLIIFIDRSLANSFPYCL